MNLPVIVSAGITGLWWRNSSMNGRISNHLLFTLLLVMGSAFFTSCQPPPLQSIGPQQNEEAAPTPIQDAEIPSGVYHRADIPGAEPDLIALGVIGVTIDRQNNTASFELLDGSSVMAPLMKVNTPTWGHGCPTSVSTTRMEILQFEADTLVLDGVVFEQPVLVATCPASSLAFVLREVGSGFGDYFPAAACDWWAGAKCIYFSQLESFQAAIPSATPEQNREEIFHSKPLFQVFILNPVNTCIVGNDFASGNICRGPNCGDCRCTWDQFDPPAPLVGIPPSQVDDPEYAHYEHKVCIEIVLTQYEIDKIIADMNLIRDQVYEWSGGALDLKMEYTILPHNHVGFVAPDFVFGPFEVDDELLHPYITTETDFIYVVTGVYDRSRRQNLTFACGGSYGEMSIYGAGYANIQYNKICNSVTINDQYVYEPLIHEWMHNLDWALYEINQVPDLYQHAGPDWAKWDHASWPACGTGDDDPTNWFPSVDLCEWDPDWIDCNNTASAGACLHAGEVGGEISWYEHVISVHYPRYLEFIGNYCRDGRQDITETGVDQGWPCP